MKIGLLGDFSFSVGLGHLYRLKGLYSGLQGSANVMFFSKSLEQSKLLKKIGIPHANVKDFDCDRLIYDGRKKIDHIYPNIRSILENSVLIDNIRNFEPKFGKAVVPSFYISNANRVKLTNNFSRAYIGLEYFFIRSSSIKNVMKPIVTFGGSDPKNSTQKIADILGDKAVYILGPLYGEKRKNKLLLSVSSNNIISAPADTYSYLASCSCVITALGTTLQEVELLQKPCFVIANYINDVIDYQAIKDCSSHPQNYKGFNYFNDDFDKRIIDFVSENNKIKNIKNFDYKSHNFEAASRWIDLLK